MQVHFGVESLAAEWNSAVVCMGTFDGVHIGHREVIRTAVDKAKQRGLPCILVTFDRNPAAVLAPEKCPPYIAEQQSNLEQFAELGVAITVVLAFDEAFSKISASHFLESYLVERLHAICAVEGHDFTFGKGREGTPEWLAARLETHIVPPFLHRGVRVSSGQIRSLISEGDVEAAAELLGRPFIIPGIVVPGQRLGRTLGYPTLNLARSFQQVTPADGIYAGYCDTPLGRFKAAISIGVRPSVDNLRTIEAYLIDYPGEEIYGSEVSLAVTRRLRESRVFANLEDLKAQIASDVADVIRVK
ncbi:MAG TPA: riboflavin biosynthesis protein RibF [Fimbriimonadaceae bacterium]|jgi:riboflavin kinase/FMN adenylyltransferase